MRAKPKSFLFIRWKLVIGLLALFILSFAIWAKTISWTPWNSTLKIWMFDVGQGDALFIEFPNGEQWLIDGGPDDAVLAKLGTVLPPWDRSIDAIVLTHPDADHQTGFISVLDRYNVETVYESGIRAHSPVDSAFMDRIAAQTANHYLLQTGDRIQVGEVVIDIVWPDEVSVGTHPDDRNNMSVNMLVTYKDLSILLTGDAEAIVEKKVAPRVGDIDVLKVGHHGSTTSSSWQFLEVLEPEYALISAGRNNVYGHPHPLILKRLESVGAQIYRTDDAGDVLLISNGMASIIRYNPLPF